MSKKNKRTDDDRYSCRWYSKGDCALERGKCNGYDVYDCGVAEDMDDCNPDLEDSDFEYGW